MSMFNDKNGRRIILPRPGMCALISAAAILGIGVGYTIRAVASASEDGAPELVRIDPMVPIPGEKPIPEAAMVPGSPDPLAGEKVFYRNSKTGLRAGVWDSGPGSLRLQMHSDEYVYVIEGRGVISSIDGNSWSFKPGDAFVLPAGFTGQAKMIGHFRKEYVDVVSSSPQR